MIEIYLLEHLDAFARLGTLSAASEECRLRRTSYLPARTYPFHAKARAGAGRDSLCAREEPHAPE